MVTRSAGQNDRNDNGPWPEVTGLSLGTYIVKTKSYKFTLDTVEQECSGCEETGKQGSKAKQKPLQGQNLQECTFENFTVF